MPRNRYTRLIRIRERVQFAHQEKQLTQLIRQLRLGITEPPAAQPRMCAKDRRSARLVHNRLHKPHKQLNDDARALRATGGPS